jgi:hypothetical protein
MTKLYTQSQRNMQDEFGTRPLALAHANGIVHEVFTDEERAFISERDMFFLATADDRGRPTVSYKGGSPGFVSFEGNNLVFPSYDGNGMYLSMGNICDQQQVGLLFIDFETPRRCRVGGVATISREFDRDKHVGAELVVTVRPIEIFVNCPRYIHRYRKEQESRHVPVAGKPQPLAPWKRIDTLYPSLSEEDRLRVTAAGTLNREEYEDMVRKM